MLAFWNVGLGAWGQTNYTALYCVNTRYSDWCVIGPTISKISIQCLNIKFTQSKNFIVFTYINVSILFWLVAFWDVGLGGAIDLF